MIQSNVKNDGKCQRVRRGESPSEITWQLLGSLQIHNSQGPPVQAANGTPLQIPTLTRESKSLSPQMAGHLRTQRVCTLTDRPTFPFRPFLFITEQSVVQGFEIQGKLELKHCSILALGS